MRVRIGQLRRWKSNGMLFVVTGAELSPSHSFTRVHTHLVTTDVWYSGKYAGEWDGKRDVWYSVVDITADSDEVQDAA